MGTDLKPIGNHTLDFNNKDYKTIASEILTILNGIEFKNAEFLRLYAIYDANHILTLHRIKNSDSRWTVQDDDTFNLFSSDGFVNFFGPYEMDLQFTANMILFDTFFGYRYRFWIEEDDFVLQDEWRKFMYQVVKAFGGDRVIYLADNSNEREKFAYLDDPFDEIEREIEKEFGKLEVFRQSKKGAYDACFIDYFTDLDWNVSKPLEKYLPEKDIVLKTDFDLSKFSSIAQWKQINIDEKKTLIKEENNTTYFYHLLTYEGLFCVHQGEIGKTESIHVEKDKYAPIVMMNYAEELHRKGFQAITFNHSFYVRVYSQNNNAWDLFMDTFTIELLWAIRGERDYTSGMLGFKQYHFSCTDEHIAIMLFFDTIKQVLLSGKIEIYRMQNEQELLIYQYDLAVKEIITINH